MADLTLTIDDRASFQMLALPDGRVAIIQAAVLSASEARQYAHDLASMGTFSADRVVRPDVPKAPPRDPNRNEIRQEAASDTISLEATR